MLGNSPKANPSILSPINQKANKIQDNLVEQDQEERVILSRKELREFTKKFASTQLSYEEEIQKLEVLCEDLRRQMQKEKAETEELKLQEEYLLSMMEQLRDRHSKEIKSLQVTCELTVQLKEQEIQHLCTEITKLREWLQEEKQQIKLCLQSNQNKDEAIQILEEELAKIKEDGFKGRGIHDLSKGSESREKKRSNSGRKIILRRKDENKENATSQKSYNPSHNNKEEFEKMIQLIEILREDKIKVEEEKMQLENMKLKLEEEKTKIFNKFRDATIESQMLREKINQMETERRISEKNNKKEEVELEGTVRVDEWGIPFENCIIKKCQMLELQVEKLTKELCTANSELLTFSHTSDLLYNDELFDD